MKLGLARDAVLIPAHSGQPAEIVDRVSGQRVYLSADEALLVDLLREGVADERILLQLGIRRGARLSPAGCQDLLQRLQHAGVLSGGGRGAVVAPAGHGVVAGEVEEEPTCVAPSRLDAEPGGLEAQPTSAWSPQGMELVDDGDETFVSPPPGYQDDGDDPPFTSSPAPHDGYVSRGGSVPRGGSAPPRHGARQDSSPFAGRASVEQPAPVRGLRRGPQDGRWSPVMRSDVRPIPLGNDRVELRSSQGPIGVQLTQAELMVAQMFTGEASPDRVVQQARSSGVSVELDQVVDLVNRLVDRGVLVPASGSQPAVAPPPPQTPPGGAPQPGPAPVVGPPPGPPAAAPAAATPPPPGAEDGQPLLEQMMGPLASRPSRVQAFAEALLDSVKPRKRSRRWLWVLLGLVLLLVGGGVAAGLVIQVPVMEQVPCTVQPKLQARVKSSVQGTVVKVSVQEGKRVAAGAVLASVEDLAAKRGVKRLKHQLESELDLLRIMKTGGTDADVRRQKGLLKQLAAEQAKLSSGCSDGTCRARLAELTADEKMAKRKLRLCDWMATPKEVEAQKKHLEAVREELRQLARRAEQATQLKSPAAGLVRDLVAQGSPVHKGQLVARLLDPKQALVQAKTSPPLHEAGARLQVEAGQPGALQRYPAVLLAATAGAQGAQLQVQGDVQQLLAAKACRVELKTRTRSWLSNLLSN